MQTAIQPDALFAAAFRGGDDDVIREYEATFNVVKSAAVASGIAPILDLGVAETFSSPPPITLNTLRSSLNDKAVHKYALNQVDAFRPAALGYLQKLFEISSAGGRLDVLHTAGAKGAMGLLAFGLLDPGDVVVTTTPGYPVFPALVRRLGGEVFELQLRKERGFLPDLNEIPKQLLSRTKAIFVNYPNNPTGSIAGREFFQQLVDLCRAYGIMAINDAAYSAIVFDPADRHSILAVAGALDCALEIHSMSKSHQMAGWRMGFIAGESSLVGNLRRIRSLLDSGQFAGIQLGAAKALENTETITILNQVVTKRLESLRRVLSDIGFHVDLPSGTFFLYVGIPTRVKNGPRFDSAMEFALFLARACGIIAVPWDSAGAFIRVSAAFDSSDTSDDDLKFCALLRQRLSPYVFEFG